jgi:hypothetical protein
MCQYMCHSFEVSFYSSLIYETVRVYSVNAHFLLYVLRRRFPPFCRMRGPCLLRVEHILMCVYLSLYLEYALVAFYNLNSRSM